jgi:hypothetical protein
MLVEHRDCGGRVTDFGTCESCGAQLTAREVRRLRPAQAGAAATA